MTAMLRISGCLLLLVSTVCAVESIESVIQSSVPILPEVIAQRIAEQVQQANVDGFSSILAGLPSGINVLESLSGFIVEAETGNDFAIASVAYRFPNQVLIELENESQYVASFERCFKASEHDFIPTLFYESCRNDDSTLTIVKSRNSPFVYAGYKGESWSTNRTFELHGEHDPFVAKVSIIQGTNEAEVTKYDEAEGSTARFVPGIGPVFVEFGNQEQGALTVLVDRLPYPSVRTYEGQYSEESRVDEHEVLSVHLQQLL